MITDFPTAKDCKFVPSVHPAADEIAASVPELHLSRLGPFLTLTHGHKEYTFALAPDGLIAGFLGKIRESSKASILIVKDGGGALHILDARFTPNLSAALAKITPQVNEPATKPLPMPAVGQNAALAAQYYGPTVFNPPRMM